jgi:hypothetical protein
MATAIDWVPTVHKNQFPLASLSADCWPRRVISASGIP